MSSRTFPFPPPPPQAVSAASPTAFNRMSPAVFRFIVSLPYDESGSSRARPLARMRFIADSIPVRSARSSPGCARMSPARLSPTVRTVTVPCDNENSVCFTVRAPSCLSIFHHPFRLLTCETRGCVDTLGEILQYIVVRNRPDRTLQSSLRTSAPGVAQPDRALRGIAGAGYPRTRQPGMCPAAHQPATSHWPYRPRADALPWFGASGLALLDWGFGIGAWDRACRDTVPFRSNGSHDLPTELRCFVQEHLPHREPEAAEDVEPELLVPDLHDLDVERDRPGSRRCRRCAWPRCRWDRASPADRPRRPRTPARRFWRGSDRWCSRRGSGALSRPVRSVRAAAARRSRRATGPDRSTRTSPCRHEMPGSGTPPRPVAPSASASASESGAPFTCAIDRGRPLREHDTRAVLRQHAESTGLIVAVERATPHRFAHVDPPSTNSRDIAFNLLIRRPRTKLDFTLTPYPSARSFAIPAHPLGRSFPGSMNT